MFATDLDSNEKSSSIENFCKDFPKEKSLPKPGIDTKPLLIETPFDEIFEIKQPNENISQPQKEEKEKTQN